MRRVALIAAVFGVATSFVAVTSRPAHAAPVSTQDKHTIRVASAAAKPKFVAVRSGDYLAKIAQANHTTALRLYYANTNIKDPDLIYPGEELRIPATGEKLAPRPLPSDASAAAPAPNVSAPASVQAPAVAPAAGSVWDRLAECESGGNWAADTGNGFYGGLQFTLSSWQAVGGSGLPSSASRAEQIERAEKLQATQGWSAWPACSAQLGL